jgi:hypothetical protein
MTFDDVYDRLPADGWLSRGEAELLWKYASRAAGPFVEVGAYQGRSSVLLASLAMAKETRLYSVDPWDNDFHSELSGDAIFERWQANTRDLPVIAMRMRVEEWLPIRASLLYLDGDHTYRGTLNQILQALRCHPDYICVHDCNDNGGGAEVKRACLETLGPWHERVERLAAWEVSRARRTALVELPG